MKKTDLLTIVLVIAVLTPFFVFDPIYATYKELNSVHPFLLAAVKFGILATFGEMLASRIKTGVYCSKDFGLIPRMAIWGLLGIWIAFAMKTFAIGVPAVVEKIGFEGLSNAMSGDFTYNKLWGAFCISLIMNTGFAPVFMTLHKVTDMHIARHQGKLRCLITPIRIGELFAKLNWKIQWNFVFKKTIPFFWVPAHTITFILPADFQILFAALLSIALGLILAVASRKG